LSDFAYTIQYIIFTIDIDIDVDVDVDVDVSHFNNKGTRYLHNDKVSENEIDGD
jgi:hypothetical protein